MNEPRADLKPSFLKLVKPFGEYTRLSHQVCALKTPLGTPKKGVQTVVATFGTFLGTFWGHFGDRVGLCGTFWDFVGPFGTLWDLLTFWDHYGTNHLCLERTNLVGQMCTIILHSIHTHISRRFRDSYHIF